MILVIKLSGKVLESTSLRRSLASDVKHLQLEGHRLVIVHGAGKQLSTLCAQLGIPVVQYEGRRVTDERTLEAAKMVFSAVNRDLVADLVTAGLPAIGIASYDAGIAKASRRAPMRVVVAPGETREVDFGLVGEIDQVDRLVLDNILGAGLCPVICSLCADEQGTILNINADTLAAELAKSLCADRLISVSDVDGIYRDPADPSTLLRRLSAEQARDHMRDGTFTEGMIPKVKAALDVIDKGVASFQIVSGLRPNALTDGVESDAGTLITR